MATKPFDLVRADSYARTIRDHTSYAGLNAVQALKDLAKNAIQEAFDLRKALAEEMLTRRAAIRDAADVATINADDRLEELRKQVKYEHDAHIHTVGNELHLKKELRRAQFQISSLEDQLEAHQLRDAESEISALQVQLERIPPDYEIVRYGTPSNGEYFYGRTGKIDRCRGEWSRHSGQRWVIRKREPETRPTDIWDSDAIKVHLFTGIRRESEDSDVTFRYREGEAFSVPPNRRDPVRFLCRDGRNVLDRDKVPAGWYATGEYRYLRAGDQWLHLDQSGRSYVVGPLSYRYEGLSTMKRWILKPDRRSS